MVVSLACFGRSTYFDIEFKNGEHAQFVGTFDYEHAVLRFENYDKLGIHMVWSHVLSWDSPAESFRQDRLEYAKSHIFTGCKFTNPKFRGLNSSHIWSNLTL